MSPPNPPRLMLPSPRSPLPTPPIFTRNCYSATSLTSTESFPPSNALVRTLSHPMHSHSTSISSLDSLASRTRRPLPSPPVSAPVHVGEPRLLRPLPRVPQSAGLIEDTRKPELRLDTTLAPPPSTMDSPASSKRKRASRSRASSRRQLRSSMQLLDLDVELGAELQRVQDKGIPIHTLFTSERESTMVKHALVIEMQRLGLGDNSPALSPGVGKLEFFHEQPDDGDDDNGYDDYSSEGSEDDEEDLFMTDTKGAFTIASGAGNRYSKRWYREKGSKRWEEENYRSILNALREL